MEATRDRQRRRYRYAGVVVFLLLLLPATWGLRAWRMAQVAATIEEQRADAVADALALIERQFHDLQETLWDRAREVASAPEVVRGLRERVRSGEIIGPRSVVAYFAKLEPGDRTSIELYDVTPRLVAWNGFSMPLDAAPASLRFMDGVQTSIARDEGLRRALVVWWPVREGNRVLGGVRVVHLIGYDAPVQNEYLRDISLADAWRRATHLPVHVDFDPPFSRPEDLQGQVRLLQGRDGTVLGQVRVEPPPPGQFLATLGQRYDHVLAFWATLLLGWLMAGLWWWYRGADDLRGAAVRRRPVPVLARFAVVAVAWWGLRYALLALDVPARWQRGKSPLAPLFNPAHLASSLGDGLFRSVGDLLLTALFAVLFGIAVIDLAARLRGRMYRLFRQQRRFGRREAGKPAPVRYRLVLLTAGCTAFGIVLLLALVTRHVVLDSTFDFFAREDLMPEPSLLVIFGALLLCTIAAVLVIVGIMWLATWLAMRYGPAQLSRWWWLEPLLFFALPIAAGYGFFDLRPLAPWSAVVFFLLICLALAAAGLVRRESWLGLLILRSVLPACFLLTMMLYPLLYRGMESQLRIQMKDAAGVFSEGRDPRVLFGIEQVLDQVRTEDFVADVLRAGPLDPRQDRRLDSLATSVLRGSLLASLAAYDISLTIFDADGAPLGRYYNTGQVLERSELDQVDVMEFEILRQMYAESGSEGVMVEQVTGRREPDRFQYEGIAPIQAEEPPGVLGWVMARAEPRSLLRDGGTPFPRVLLPASSYDDLYSQFSVAEFRSGVLVRSIGRDFGRYRLDDEVQLELEARGEVWRFERVEQRRFLTYYRRQEPSSPPDALRPLLTVAEPSVLAVRVASINTFDHLFYVLRLMVAGLILALPLYVFGIYLRRRAGLLPAPRVRFRDRVLNAFLGVGMVTVAAVGFVGLRVVTEENARATQYWLRQHLDRVEEMLALGARGEEMPYRVLERTQLDSLAALVALDLNIYRGEHLAALSRPQLGRERLIDERLPIEAYQALYFDGYRFTYTQEQVGSFAYMAGFQALPDEQGRPRYIISVPTLPEQERIEEERARTVAYLFGALLLLVLVVMFTAALLANAIARPVARLRSGLKAVAKGHFEQILHVDSRDEIGELVQTFNEMQAQLAETRRKVAQQERQLAWREMARQVAHEIKNPLTPMKLSVQHLRRAYESDGADANRREKFDRLFERITGTLIEQIDTLARIANEFHSFARMPSRVLERVDLNAVVGEAVALMQEENAVEIRSDLHDAPLVVEADREELRRNYINLIKNAIQAVPEDRQAQIVVTTRLEENGEGRWAYSTVVDNGTGVPEELQEKIFEPNFSTKTSGTGLGLAIVRKSIEELRGEIDFETEDGVGTTFWIRLPLAE